MGRAFFMPAMHLRHKPKVITLATIDAVDPSAYTPADSDYDQSDSRFAGLLNKGVRCCMMMQPYCNDI